MCIVLNQSHFLSEMTVLNQLHFFYMCFEVESGVHNELQQILSSNITFELRFWKRIYKKKKMEQKHDLRTLIH